ncbi:MAG: restriction endonuclease subunit S [Methyloprofundus sp.]|nr:restriction endonuclease subunit S [Methyloprofundus sp.]
MTTELSLRKQQYKHYRDQLLRFAEGEVEWKTLGEVAEIKRGRRLVKSQLEEYGKYAVFQNSMTPLGYYHESNVHADTAFIISAGSAGEIGYSGVDFWAADDVYYFVTPENLKSKFLYYFLLTQQIKITGQVRRSSVPRLSKTSFEKMPIPVPTLEEQARIVAILDKFDTLTTSISAGLPREIELRQKQYAYYRDLLLRFPRAKEEAA